jgi:hypothetical protein
MVVFAPGKKWVIWELSLNARLTFLESERRDIMMVMPTMMM